MPIFANKDFRRGLEFQLTEALVKAVELYTPYKTTSNPNAADTTLSGEIIEVRQGTLGLDFRTHLPRGTQATVIASFRWKDNRDGKILAQMKLITQSVDYIRPVGENFYEASQEALNDLAERIVEKMETELNLYNLEMEKAADGLRQSGNWLESHKPGNVLELNGKTYTYEQVAEDYKQKLRRCKECSEKIAEIKTLIAEWEKEHGE